MAWILAALCSAAGAASFAADESNSRSPIGQFESGNLKDLQSSADTYEYIGNNLIASGHAVVRYKDMQIMADKALVNISSKDIEVVGNVTFVRRVVKAKTVDYWEYQDLLDDPSLKVQFERYITSATGKQMIEVTIIKNDTYMTAQRAIGNLATGALVFSNFSFNTGPIFCIGAKAERAPDGTITVKDATITTCEYVLDGHEHYSIHAGRAVISPRGEANVSVSDYNVDHGEHSIWAYNTTFRIGDVPILWLPAMYKAPDSDSFGVESHMGNSSAYGYYVQTRKVFQLMDSPNIRAIAMADYYTKRGLGSGLELQMNTENSKTEAFAYGIHDNNPYEGYDSDNHAGQPDWVKKNARLKTETNRYDLKLSNVTHITPRLDFRGQIEKLSDVNMLKDYFPARYADNPQPPTFADLEYQFDRASVALLTDVRVNTFDTVTQKLPEFRVDIQRQELFKNIYYQGENSAAYMKQTWREYDTKRTLPNYVDPANYSTSRFDTLHMFYYPFKLDWLNIIPRAGLRLTSYGQTSSRGINVNDLNNMYDADAIDGQPNGNVVNYDSSGGSKLRVAGETGFEMNTKIYRSWQNVKNAFWELDGLRHVAVPYINYTLIPDPSVKNSHIMYFDDIDRIERENFVRLGMNNRLQTRRGAYGSEQIYEWMSMENYFDFHLQKQNGYENAGNIGNIFKFNPFPGLSLSSLLLLDPTESDGHNAQAIRGNYQAGRPGISWKGIDMWNNTVSYSFAKDWKVYGGYNYQDAYMAQSAYSMGSTLTQINSTSAFQRWYQRSQIVNGGFDFPILSDKKMTGGVFAAYDVDGAVMNNIGFRLMRKFHCWYAALEVARGTTRGENYSKENKHSIGFSVGLTTMPSLGLGQRGSNSETNSNAPVQ